MLSKSEFAPRLIAWQRMYGRHDLPWQNTRDPYRIWLAEIMLQQTQVASVIQYYHRFLARFPDLVTLANAPLDEVMACWSGLGYYARARHLQCCAQKIVHEYGGVFPCNIEMLVTLPGIGRSTASAIAAFAFGARQSILDGNVKRVLTRIFGIEGFPGAARVENALWTLAESLLPPLVAHQEENISTMRVYTQGLMDLGALVCTRTRPHCARCPFQNDCVACATHRTHELPQARPKKMKPVRRTLMLILRSGNSVLLERRASKGIWGGLWSLPEATDEAELLACAARFGAFNPFTPLTPITHTFTHFQLIIEPRLVRLPTCVYANHCLEHFSARLPKKRARRQYERYGEREATQGKPLKNALASEQAWVPLCNIHQYGLPAPVRRLLISLFHDDEPEHCIHLSSVR